MQDSGLMKRSIKTTEDEGRLTNHPPIKTIGNEGWQPNDLNDLSNRMI